MSHSGLQMRATFLPVTTGARPWAYKALPRHLLSRSKVGNRRCVTWFCLRERCARKKKRTRDPATDEKLSSYAAWKHHIPGLNSGLTQRILRRLFLNDSLSFHYGQDAVHAWYDNLFSLAARPLNLNFFKFCGCPQPEMKTQIRARGITSSAENVAALVCTARGEEDLCTDGIPRTLCSTNQFESDPVVAILYDIAEQRGRRIHII